MTVDILIGNCYLRRMAKSSDSKEKTLIAAAQLFCRRGYHGTALQDILAASGAPRGSLYFHFPRGKEEIAEGAVALGDKAVRAFIAQVATASRSAETFAINLARGMAARLEASDFREGCPLATTALEIATASCPGRKPPSSVTCIPLRSEFPSLRRADRRHSSPG